MKKLEAISKGVRYWIIVDDEDYSRVLSAGPWWICRNKHLFYVKRHVKRSGKRTTQGLHHFIAGFVGIDHINGDPVDNRKSNLRAATQAQNNQNVRLASNNTSGYRGVSWHTPDRKWTARVGVESKSIWVGTFDDREAAAKAVKTARMRLLPYSNENE